jgi:hypothetical protein
MTGLRVTERIDLSVYRSGFLHNESRESNNKLDVLVPKPGRYVIRLDSTAYDVAHIEGVPIDRDQTIRMNASKDNAPHGRLR